MTQRQSDRFIWGQTAKCLDIYRGPALMWGSVTEGDCAREPGMRKYGHPAARDYCVLYLKKGFQDTTQSAQKWTKHQNYASKPFFLSSLKGSYHY